MPRAKKKSNRADGRYEIKRVIGKDPNGNSIRKSFYGDTKQDAIDAYEDFKRDYERKQYEREIMPFDAWARQWLEVYKREDVKEATYYSTYKRPVEGHLIPFFGSKPLREITQLDCKKFANSIANYSQSRINKAMICLRGILDAAEDNDLIAKNPAKRVTVRSTQQKQGKRVYDKETADFLAGQECRYALLVAILIRMGLRASELCGLRWEDIDLAEGYMTIRQAITSENGNVYVGAPKTQTSIRHIPIPSDLLERLRRENGTGYVAMMGENHMTPQRFGYRQMTVFYNAVGVPAEKRLSPHELRHTCGTLMYEETRDIYRVSRFLGHSDIGITTKIYVHSEFSTAKVHISASETTRKKQ